MTMTFTPPGPFAVEHPFAVTLRNEGPEPIRVQYLTHLYVIPASGQALVPWEVMVDAMGNPDARDVDRHKDRTKEATRLRVRYGAYHDDSLWAEQRPPLAAFDPQGERITTVLDDPTGETVTTANASIASQAALEQQVHLLHQQLGAITTAAQQQGLVIPGLTTNSPPGPVLSPSGAPIEQMPAPSAPMPSNGTVGGTSAPINPLIPDERGPVPTAPPAVTANGLPEIIVPTNMPSSAVGQDGPNRLPVTPEA